jgi:protein-tyrosine phosphatase
VSGVRVLVVCTANVCRSPMAAAFLDDALHGDGIEAVVTSAGIRPADLPVDPVATAALAEFGLDISGHRPRAVTREMVETDGADLVVTMTREHVRTVAVLERAAWPRTFTLRELVRRAEAVESRDCSIDAWVAALGAGRRPSAVLGDDPADDIADPYGAGRATVWRTAAELRSLVARLVQRWPLDDRDQ